MTKYLPLALALVVSVGCAASEKTVTEGDKHLAHQNLSAAEKILEQALVIKHALEGVGVSSSSAALAAVTYIQQAATDIAKNSQRQLANWGGAPKDAVDYDEKESERRRKQSEDEHSRITWWTGVAATIGAAGVWAAKQFGLGWLPLVGGWLKKKAPALALGDTSKGAVTEGLMVAMDEGRVKLDDAITRLKDKLKSLLPDAGDAIVDAVQLPDLKAIVVKEMERRGVLPANTLLYEASPDTGGATKT